MDDVSGLADKSDNFANFLTISENLTFPVFMLFMPYTLQDLAGR